MPKNETTPGRGYPLPVAENTLNVDVKRLRDAITAIDEDYTGLVKKWQEFAALAGEYLKKIDDRQDLFDEDTAEAFKQFEWRREELIRALQANHNELMADMRGDVDLEIARLTSFVPHYNNLLGDLYSAGSSLPGDGTVPLEYVDGLGFYRYDAKDTTPPDGEFILAAGGGIGRWRLVLPSVETMLAALGEYTSDVGSRIEEDTTKLKKEIEGLKTQKLSSTASLAFGAIAAGTSVSRNITITGVAMGDPVSLVPPASLVSGLVYSGYVAAAETITVRVTNITTAAITPATADWTAVVIKEGSQAK